MTSPQRSMVGVAAAAAALALLLPAGAASSAENRDSVTGKGSSAIADFEFSGFNQGTTPDTPAGGQWRATNPVIDFRGPITCLHVEGNRAAFLYPVEAGSTPEAAVGQVVMIFIEDNGPGNVDKMGFLGPAPLTETGPCVPGPTPLDVEGDIVVVDAQ